MNLASALRWHLNVTVLGQAWLEWDRLRLARRLRRPWRHPHLGPPLLTSPRLKELISRHYLRGRFANDRYPVAWVTSGAPVEVLVALGYFVIYPENHGAVCGIRRVGDTMAAHAEAAGYSPDLCSYARADIGSALSGETPVGRLPKPDLLVCCTNICQTVILHSDRSCKPYSIGQVDQRARLATETGVPALLLEADHNDPRSFSEQQATTRLHAFIEMLAA